MAKMYDANIVIENFDGANIVGWAQLPSTEGAFLSIAVDDLGERKLGPLHPRQDAKGKTSPELGHFVIRLDDIFPEIFDLEYSYTRENYEICLSICSSTEDVLYRTAIAASWPSTFSALSARPKWDGRVDTCDENWISGWFVAPEGERTTIEIWIDGKKVSTGSNGLYRGDVFTINRKGKYSGFVIPTPHQLKDGFLHQLDVRAFNSSWSFPGYPKEIRLGEFVGVVEKIERNSVSGWLGFQRGSNHSARTLNVICNGTIIGSTILRAKRPDISAAGIAGEAYAFHFETQRGMFAEDHVEVVEAQTGYALRIEPTARNQALPSAISGHIDNISESEIVGWAVDRRSPAAALEVIVVADGVPVGSSRTEAFRADVQKVFPQALRPGFVVSTPPELRDGRPHQIDLVIKGSGPLRGGAKDKVLPKLQPVFGNLKSDPLSQLESSVEKLRSPRKIKREHKEERAGVSLIILNKDGGDVFVNCLISLVRHVNLRLDELIVVDHASSDQSKQALKLMEATGLAKVIWKRQNDSFSQSNNDGVDLASRESVLFLNNDIQITKNFLPSIERHLSDPTIGAVGIKLFDIQLGEQAPTAAGAVRDLKLQHLGVWFKPGHANTSFNMLGYDVTAADNYDDLYGLHDVAVVTGAALAIRKRVFVEIGKFDSGYFYGTEDIDLCLRVRNAGYRVVCDRDLEALHVRGYTRFTHRGNGASDRFANNNKRLWKKLGAALKRDYLQSTVSRDGVYRPANFRVGFAVSEAGDNVIAGDYFTAKELAMALAGHPNIEYVFLSEKEDWYDCADLDALVVMRHDYDLRSVRNLSSHCILVGWPRNHFTSWLEQPWVQEFDVTLSSSRTYAKLLRRRYGIKAHLLYIASSFSQRPSSEHQSLDQDVVFIGSRWGGGREIEAALKPDQIQGTVSVFGAGFENSELKSVWRGLAPYNKVEEIYHRSRIVVDDANATTKRWGSPNSRVFDAIAAGAIVVSNSTKTSEVLGHSIPVWNDSTDLTQLLNELIHNKELARTVRQQQQRQFEGVHSYAGRAEQFLNILDEFSKQSLRIDILTAVPPQADENLWGDWHYAQALAEELRKNGHRVILRKLGEGVQRAADVVIGLRGLTRYTPVVGAINLLWVISHPDLISPDEVKEWDHVFAASKVLAEKYQSFGASSSVLYQATKLTPVALEPYNTGSTKGIFVGNTRGVTREFIHVAADAGLEFGIIGDGWSGTSLSGIVEGKQVPNSSLSRIYANASFVLSDHWPDMAREGVISNRVFDALASGSVVISDAVDRLDSLGLPNLYVCNDINGLRNAAGRAAATSYEARRAGALWVVQRHSFKTRANTIEAIAWRLIQSQGATTVDLLQDVS